MSHPVSQFDAELGEFLQLAGTLWRHYQSVGPGQVDSILFDRLDLSAKGLTHSLDTVADIEDIAKTLQNDDATRLSELVGTINKVLRLAKRCACSPLGAESLTCERRAFKRQSFSTHRLSRMWRLSGSVGRRRRITV